MPKHILTRAEHHDELYEHMKSAYRKGDWEVASRIAHSLLRQPDLQTAIKGTCFMMLATGTENAHDYLQAGLETYQSLADEAPPPASARDHAYERYLGSLLGEGKEVLGQMQALNVAAASRAHQQGGNNQVSASGGSAFPSTGAGQRGGQEGGRLAARDPAAPAMGAAQNGGLTSNDSVQQIVRHIIQQTAQQISHQTAQQTTQQ